MILRIHIFILFIALFFISLKAQTLSPNVISSTGGFFISTNATLSFTVAEMTMVQTFSPLTNILTQGFQQPEQLTTSVKENLQTTGETIIYPNPTNGAFTFARSASDIADCTVKIYNQVGQLLFTQIYNSHIGENKIQIDINGYRQGVYLLKFFTGGPDEEKKSGLHKINLVY